MTCLAIAPYISLRADPLSAGPLFDEFKLTLSPGYRTEILGPLFYSQTAGSQTIWAIPPLFSDTKDSAIGLREWDFLYPLMTYDRYGSQYRWQFLQLLSFAGGASQTSDVKKRFTLFPIYFQQRASNPAENYTALLPFYGHIQGRLFRDEISFIMFPFYVQSRKRDIVTDNYLFPIVHVRHGLGLEGWQVWPFVGSEHKDVTTRTNGFGDVQTVPGHDHVFVLWPIFFNDHSGLGTDNPDWMQAALPFYSFERSPQRDATTVIWPFFSHIDDRQKKYREWDAPWPLIEFARGEGKTTDRVWPFFSQSHNETLVDNFYLWPIYKYTRAHSDPLDRERTRILFFLYSDIHEKNTETKEVRTSSYLWPLFTHRKDPKGRTRLQLIAPLEPFVQGSHKIERDWSPLWSVWRAEEDPITKASSQSLLWNLYRNDADPGHKKVSILFGLFQYQSGPESKRVRLFYIPLSSSRAAQARFSPLGAKDWVGQNMAGAGK
jgi:hypothetical protein